MITEAGPPSSTKLNARSGIQISKTLLKKPGKSCMYRLSHLVNIFVRATNLKNIIFKKLEEGGADFTIVLNFFAFITLSLRSKKKEDLIWRQRPSVRPSVFDLASPTTHLLILYLLLEIFK
jgi:hypothetical protein